MKKIIEITLAIVSILFGFPIIAKSAYLFWRYQLWLGSFIFEVNSWKDEDRTIFGVAGIFVTALIILLWGLYFFPDKKE